MSWPTSGYDFSYVNTLGAHPHLSPYSMPIHQHCFWPCVQIIANEISYIFHEYIVAFNSRGDGRNLYFYHKVSKSSEEFHQNDITIYKKLCLHASLANEYIPICKRFGCISFCWDHTISSRIYMWWSYTYVSRLCNWHRNDRVINVQMLVTKSW